MRYLSLFILTSLTIGGCSESPKPVEAPTTTASSVILNPGENGCKRCHNPHLAPPHDLSCASCHGGDDTSNDQQQAHAGLIPQPAHPASMNKGCGTCHGQEVAAVAGSLHLTQSGKINLVRRAFGAQQDLNSFTEIPAVEQPQTILELTDDLLRRRCLRCHLSYPGDQYPLVAHGTGCAACHMDFTNGKPISRTFLAIPGNKQCLHCHYGNWVGADYHGRFEHDFNEEYRTPYTSKGPFTRPYGVEFHQLVPDIHQQKGMICVDCHSGAELMNLPDTTSVTCQDCHSEEALKKKLPPGVSQGSNGFSLHGKGDNRPHPIPLMRNPAHDTFQATVTCQACHAQWSFNDTGTHLLRNDTSEQDAFWRLTTQGSWEVEKILTYNLNFEPATPLPPTMTDKISGEEKRGLWHQGYIMRRWENIQLGRDKDGKVAVMRPVLDLHLSWIDERHTVRFDANSSQDGNKGLLPYTPHTTGAAGIFYRHRLAEFFRTEKAAEKNSNPPD